MQGHTKTTSKGMEEDLSSKWRAKKKAGVAILVSDKIDFKPTKIKRQRTLHNGKRIDATRRANDPKHIRTQNRSTQIHKVSS